MKMETQKQGDHIWGRGRRPYKSHAFLMAHVRRVRNLLAEIEAVPEAEYFSDSLASDADVSENGKQRPERDLANHGERYH